MPRNSRCGAAADGPDIWLQWGRGIDAAEFGTTGNGLHQLILLQWGRGIDAAEFSGQPVEIARQDIVRGFNGAAASMPRNYATLQGRRGEHAQSGFNGAAASMPRNCLQATDGTDRRMPRFNGAAASMPRNW